jgi:hypothetical protein
MKLASLVALAFVSGLAAVAGQAQATNPATAKTVAADKPPLEIISHKIGLDYYPMLDRPPASPHRASLPTIPS